MVKYFMSNRGNVVVGCGKCCVSIILAIDAPNM